MTNEEIKMIEKLEQARKKSEESRSIIFTYSNGHEVIFYAENVAKQIEKDLKKKGYWVCSIFCSGMRAEA